MSADAKTSRHEHVLDFKAALTAGRSGLINKATERMLRCFMTELVTDTSNSSIMRTEEDKGEDVPKASSSAHPTEMQERAKKRNALGIVSKKKTFKVQDHYDDCGKDLSGIGITAFHINDFHYELPGGDESDDDGAGMLVQWHMYLGSEVELEDTQNLELPTTIRKVANVAALFHLLIHSAPGDYVIEFCGGKEQQELPRSSCKEGSSQEETGTYAPVLM